MSDQESIDAYNTSTSEEEEEPSVSEDPTSEEESSSEESSIDSEVLEATESINEEGSDKDHHEDQIHDFTMQFLLHPTKTKKSVHKQEEHPNRKVRRFQKKQLKAKEDPVIKKLLGELNSAFFHNQYRDVVEIACKINVLNKDVTEPYIMLAKVYDQAGAIEKVFFVKRALASIEETDPRCWYECAKLAFKLGLTEETLKCFNRAMKQCHADTFVHRRKVLYLKFEKFKAYRSMRLYSYIIKQTDDILQELDAETVGEGLAGSKAGKKERRAACLELSDDDSEEELDDFDDQDDLETEVLLERVINPHFKLKPQPKLKLISYGSPKQLKTLFQRTKMETQLEFQQDYAKFFAEAEEYPELAFELISAHLNSKKLDLSCLSQIATARKQITKLLEFYTSLFKFISTIGDARCTEFFFASQNFSTVFNAIKEQHPADLKDEPAYRALLQIQSSSKLISMTLNFDPILKQSPPLVQSLIAWRSVIDARSLISTSSALGLDCSKTIQFLLQRVENILDQLLKREDLESSIRDLVLLTKLLCRWMKWSNQKQEQKQEDGPEQFDIGEVSIQASALTSYGQVLRTFYITTILEVLAMQPNSQVPRLADLRSLFGQVLPASEPPKLQLGKRSSPDPEPDCDSESENDMINDFLNGPREQVKSEPVTRKKQELDPHEYSLQAMIADIKAVLEATFDATQITFFYRKTQLLLALDFPAEDFVEIIEYGVLKILRNIYFHWQLSVHLKKQLRQGSIFKKQAEPHKRIIALKVARHMKSIESLSSAIEIPPLRHDQEPISTLKQTLVHVFARLEVVSRDKAGWMKRALAQYVAAIPKFMREATWKTKNSAVLALSIQVAHSLFEDNFSTSAFKILRRNLGSLSTSKYAWAILGVLYRHSPESKSLEKVNELVDPDRASIDIKSDQDMTSCLNNQKLIFRMKNKMASNPFINDMVGHMFARSFNSKSSIAQYFSQLKYCKENDEVPALVLLKLAIAFSSTLSNRSLPKQEKELNFKLGVNFFREYRQVRMAEIEAIQSKVGQGLLQEQQAKPLIQEAIDEVKFNWQRLLLMIRAKPNANEVSFDNRPTTEGGVRAIINQATILRSQGHSQRHATMIEEAGERKRSCLLEAHRLLTDNIII